MIRFLARGILTNDQVDLFFTCVVYVYGIQSCLIFGRVPQDLHIEGSFLVIRWLWEI